MLQINNQANIFLFVMQRVSVQQLEIILELFVRYKSPSVLGLHPEWCFELHLTKGYSQDI